MERKKEFNTEKNDIVTPKELNTELYVYMRESMATMEVILHQQALIRAILEKRDAAEIYDELQSQVEKAKEEYSGRMSYARQLIRTLKKSKISLK